MKLIVKIANILRRILKKNRLEFGADLSPNYVRDFKKEEIASELYEGGFKLEFYSNDFCGYAVGIAANQK